MRTVLLFACFVLMSVQAQALEFVQLGGTFSMHGDIQKGDAAKFWGELAFWEVPPTIFNIDSQGGNLHEAMLIGELIRKIQIPVWSGTKCYSACVFVLVSGVERKIRGDVGLHRPYFEPELFAGLSSFQAEKKYKELENASSTYLKEMGVPQRVVERIFATNSQKIDILSPEDASEIFEYRIPFYDEWMAAKCGRLTERERQIIDSYASLKAAAMTIKLINNSGEENTDSLKKSFAQHATNSGIAYDMLQAGTLDPFIELSEKRYECETAAARRHRRAFHTALKIDLEGRSKR